MKSVATQEYWDSHWKETIFEPASNDHPIRQWIEKEIPDTTIASCMEIGCYPGKFLSVFGEKGYELNGIDSFSGLDALPRWLKGKGYRCSNFYKVDFLDFKSPIKYDVVCSFGFIEHFEKWPDVLDKHLELVKPGGTLVIDVPNLNSPVYHFLYKFLEPSVLANHVLPSMDIAAITSVLAEKGCRIERAEYVGHFYFRFVTKYDFFHKTIARIINSFGFLMKLFPASISRRYIGIIVTKAS